MLVANRTGEGFGLRAHCHQSNKKPGSVSKNAHKGIMAEAASPGDNISDASLANKMRKRKSNTHQPVNTPDAFPTQPD